MKFNRTKNASRNIVFGLIQRVYQLLVPFLMRTAMIYWLGVEYLGLDGLFTSILSVLNLAELGVGSAMVYAMYKPVAEDNKEKICAYMYLYRVYYRIIGVLVLVGGLVLCPFIPYLISSDIPNDINIYILFLLNLFATVLSYWLYAYKNSLLHAYQRMDIISKVTMLINTIKYILQFLLLFVFHDYYMYLIVSLVSQAMTNVTTAYVVNNMFPGYDAVGKLEKQEVKTINQRIRDLFTAKVGAVVVNSMDTLIISAFLGLNVLAIYHNYYYIVTALLSIVNIFIYSCTAGIGNSLIVETKEKNFNDMNLFTFIIFCISFFCTSCLLCIYQPFMELWVGKDLMFELPAVICFSSYFFVVQINTLLNTYKDAAGIWHEDRFRPLVTAIVNLLMNLLTVKFLGVYGVLLSTVLSMLLVGMPWLLKNLFTTIFKPDMSNSYVKKLLEYTFIASLGISCSYIISILVPFEGIILIICRGLICFIISIFCIYLFFRKTVEFKQTIQLADRITKNKLKLEKFITKGGNCNE